MDEMNPEIPATQVIRRGNDVYLEIEISDHTRRPYRLFDPDGGVTYTLIDPDGTTILNAVDMETTRKGVYFVRYQSVGGDVLGVWSAEVRAVHDGAIGVSRIYTPFELVAD